MLGNDRTDRFNLGIYLAFLFVLQLFLTKFSIGFFVIFLVMEFHFYFFFINIFEKLCFIKTNK